MKKKLLFTPETSSNFSIPCSPALSPASSRLMLCGERSTFKNWNQWEKDEFTTFLPCSRERLEGGAGLELSLISSASHTFFFISTFLSSSSASSSVSTSWRKGFKNCLLDNHTRKGFKNCLFDNHTESIFTSSAEENSSWLTISSSGTLTTNLLIRARSGSFFPLTLVKPSSLVDLGLSPSLMLTIFMAKPSWLDLIGEDLIPVSSNAMSVKVLKYVLNSLLINIAIGTTELLLSGYLFGDPYCSQMLHPRYLRSKYCKGHFFLSFFNCEGILLTGTTSPENKSFSLDNKETVQRVLKLLIIHHLNMNESQLFS